MNDYVFLEIRNDDFDPLIVCPDAPFTQASFYGDWQKSLGRAVKRFLVYRDKEVVAYFQLVKYPLLLGKSYFYAPYGPVVKDFSEDLMVGLKKELLRIARNEGAVFIRLDFTPPASNDVLSKFFTRSELHTYHSAYFQPRAEWFLPLNKTNDDLLKELRWKTRQSIRLPEKRGVIAEIVSSDFKGYFTPFYELMTETAARDRFTLHPKNYYEIIFKNLRPEHAYLSLAKYEEKILSITLVIVYGRIATSVFSGSSNEYRNIRPNYLAQWRAICHARDLNCSNYNFGGIETENKIYKGWGGLTSFKKQFGGREMRHSDFFDVVANHFWYRLYNLRKLVKKIVA